MSIRTFQATCTCGWSKSTDRNMLAAAQAAGTVDAKVDGNAFAVALLAGTWAEHLRSTGAAIHQPVDFDAASRHALTFRMVD